MDNDPLLSLKLFSPTWSDIFIPRPLDGAVHNPPITFHEFRLRFQNVIGIVDTVRSLSSCKTLDVIFSSDFMELLNRGRVVKF